MKVEITTVIHPDVRKRGQRDLVVTATLEREITLLPAKGADIVLELEAGPLKQRYWLTVRDCVHLWKAAGATELQLYLSGQFRDLIALAVVHNWHVERGLAELSEDQQSLIACVTGTCQHAV